MHYCEVTPGNNRGIVHLSTLLFLEDCNIVFDRDSKLLNCTDCSTGETARISPIFKCQLLEDSRLQAKNTYQFKVAFKVIDQWSKKNIKNLNCHSEESDPIDIGGEKEDLFYLRSRGSKILRGFSAGIRESKVSCLSPSEELKWTEFRIGLRDLIILEENLLSVDVSSREGLFCIILRIGIRIDRKLSHLDLKVSSLSEIGIIKELKGLNKLQIKCKGCETQIESLSEFYCVLLPSDLYLKELSSIYCEECQGDINIENNPEEPEIGNKNKVLYLGKDTLKITSGYRNHNNLEELEDQQEINCISCQEVLGFKKEDSVTYLNNKVSAFNKNHDILWRNSELGETVEKIQFEERQNIKIKGQSEVLEIIKVTKEPDTFIFIENNPVITSRVLYKISNINKELNNNSLSNKNNNSIEVSKREFQHLKTLFALFSHDRDQTDWIASLLPQL